MKNILVTIDFNNNEKVLVDKAIEMARAFKAKVWLLHVTSPEPEFIGYGVGPQYIRDNRAEVLRKEHRQIEEYTNIILHEEIECEGLLLKGATVDMIMEQANKLSIDLIITGHHEHSLLYKAFFASVASNLMKKANITLMIVPLNE